MKTSTGIKSLSRNSYLLHCPVAIALFSALVGFEAVATPITPSELVAPKFEIVGGALNFTVQPSVAGRSYQLQYSETMVGGTWLNLGGVVSGNGSNLVMTTPYVSGVSRRFFRLKLDGATVVLDGFVLIPAGSFQMGDQSNPLVGDIDELPVHSVQVSAFHMGKYEVTQALWDEVRDWGLMHGYTDLPIGRGKAANHPVRSISWYAMVKWCNARSQKENLTPCYLVSGEIYKTENHPPGCDWNASGFRLPTEAEWEKAARGGLNAKNFPWGDTISHSQANYYSDNSISYDVSPTLEYHPDYNVGFFPFTSPVGSFDPNGYGLYDMAGNMWEWCWDAYDVYSDEAQIDPRGLYDEFGQVSRVHRGSGFETDAYGCRVAFRNIYIPELTSGGLGFRLARSYAP